LDGVRACQVLSAPPDVGIMDGSNAYRFWT
jgi:hypothetical protein